MTDTPEKVERSEAEWRALLTPEQYRILREKDTERPFTGALTENHETGELPLRRMRSVAFHERSQV